MDTKIHFRRKIANSRDRFLFRNRVTVDADDLLAIVVDAENYEKQVNAKNRQIAHFVEAGNTQSATIASLRQQMADALTHNNALARQAKKYHDALDTISKARTPVTNGTSEKIIRLAENALK